ncbi:PEP/pyruvate-binding domain-containing protein [Butyrivibrio sp. INlla14]|uniref:PEP/pyruvate-binding domain-containing protein n=1 Tax=Butyrivibrio sp. INlla14 TaxID=1520808 RepID=UPI000876930B|nr:PEP/pyruvate-binding domain-containing protein [Butyrivibrio sp. INlla14]SCX90725.1 pyruvate, water dikinase [Butyrivibrio sp. INlla14]
MLSKKAANLITLRERNINVPPFVVVSYDEVKKAGGVEKYHFKNPFLENAEGEYYAVRSACSLEDNKDASFAGQFDTYLNVAWNDIDAMITKCYKSLTNDCVKSYLKSKKISASNIKMDVIVQKMVDADFAGVIFTANPQGILNETVISVSRGLGEGVVADKADSVTYYYNLTDNIYYSEGKENLLSYDFVTRLIDITSQIKDIFGDYLDIEFAIKDGEIFILQTRDITTIKGEKPLIFDNSNIVESYPGLSLPLTESFVDVVYSGVFRGVCKRILKDDRELSKFEENVNNMVGHVNGRVYYKISNWYALLKCLPFNSFIIPVWQEMLGVKNKSYDKGYVKQSPFMRAKIYRNTLSELRKVPQQMENLAAEFEKINKSFYEKDINNLSSKELKAIYEELKIKLLDIWDITLLNDLYAFVYTGLLKKRLKRKYKKNDDSVNAYISGISNIESLKPIKEMIALAMNKGWMEPSQYEMAKQAYISEYGDRNLEELKLESKTFRTNPELLDKRIDEYREDLDKLFDVYQDMNAKKQWAETEKFDEYTTKLIKRCTLGIANRESSRLNRTRIFGIVRTIFLQIGKNLADKGIIESQRDIFYLTIDEIWDLVESDSGTLSEECDTEKNLTRNAGNTEASAGIKYLIHNRKEDYKFFEKLPAYTRIIFEVKEFDKKCARVSLHKNSFDGKKLQGVPCSNGVVTGEALVVTDVNARQDVKDKILITAMTDPGWVFLLATAKGVIAQKGSILSHTAIISRELGIPSIVGVDNVLSAIHSGDMITMNGNTGEIQILKEVKDVAS